MLLSVGQPERNDTAAFAQRSQVVVDRQFSGPLRLQERDWRKQVFAQLRAASEQPHPLIVNVVRYFSNVLRQLHCPIPVSYLACHRARLMGDLQPEIVTELRISTRAGT